MLQQLNIRRRLQLGFGLVLALLCAMAALAAWQLSRLAANTDQFAVNLLPSYESMHRISMDCANARRLQLLHLATPTAAGKEALDQRLAALDRDVETEMGRYARELISDDHDRALMDATRAGVATLAKDWERLQALSRAAAGDPAKRDAADALNVAESKRDFEALEVSLGAWWSYNMKLAGNETRAAAATYASARWLLGALTLAAVVLGLGAAVVITRSIVGPIRRAVDVATRVAGGDLTVKVEAVGRDETAQLLQALERMVGSLGGIVGQVRESSNSIATGSMQIASGNADLSQRTEEQASNLQQTAASMEQMAGSVRHGAAVAGEACALAREASGAADAGGRVVESVVETIQEISRSSQRIADIIGVIDGIAFQTNILALNAAVEAARAGEQGRGFAVVATEVRSLASRSADAAREIKSLITASVEKVEVGVERAGEAGASMTRIVDQVRRVTQMIEELSTSAGEQSTGIGQISHAVAQLDQVTQQNAALVEESAAASESLRHQASTLAEVVGTFRVAE